MQFIILIALINDFQEIMFDFKAFWILFIIIHLTKHMLIKIILHIHLSGSTDIVSLVLSNYVKFH